MTSAVSLKRRKMLAAAVAAKPSTAPHRLKPEVVVQRRELAMLLRSIKTLVRQSP
jgi:hypothetical protein